MFTGCCGWFYLWFNSFGVFILMSEEKKWIRVGNMIAPLDAVTGIQLITGCNSIFLKGGNAMYDRDVGIRKLVIYKSFSEAVEGKKNV